MTIREVFKRERLVAAHRGYRAVRAENTLSAFEASIGHCDFVELDVGFSSDGVPVIIHDDTLTRTSNAEHLAHFRSPYLITSYSYAELIELDFSSWFLESDPFGTLAKSERLRTELKVLPPQKIPTLHEALFFLKKQHTPVNVEIKDMRGTVMDAYAVSKTLEVIHTLGMEEAVLLSSFNHAYLKEAKVASPEVMRAALQEDRHPEDLLAYLAALDVSCYHVDKEIADEALVQRLNEAGIIVNVFTVNDPSEMERLYSWGVKGVFTDYLR